MSAHLDQTEDMMKKIHSRNEVGKEFEVLKADDIWNTLEEKLEAPPLKFQSDIKKLTLLRLRILPKRFHKAN